MKDYIIYTASDPAAVSLVDYLQRRGFMAYDEVLAEAATVLVFSTNRQSLVRAVKDAEKRGEIAGFYKISIAEVGKEEFVVMKDKKGD